MPTVLFPAPGIPIRVILFHVSGFPFCAITCFIIAEHKPGTQCAQAICTLAYSGDDRGSGKSLPKTRFCELQLSLFVPGYRVYQMAGKVHCRAVLKRYNKETGGTGKYEISRDALPAAAAAGRNSTHIRQLTEELQAGEERRRAVCRASALLRAARTMS